MMCYLHFLPYPVTSVEIIASGGVLGTLPAASKSNTETQISAAQQRTSAFSCMAFLGWFGF